MAATRVIATIAAIKTTTTTTTTTTTPLLFRKTHQSLTLCFINNRLVSSNNNKKKRLFTCCARALYKPDYQIIEEGQPETLDYRIFFLDNSGKKVSPWHDIPLHLGDGLFNCIVEIPKESSAKMELATDEQYTPIKQDTKKGKLRYYPFDGRTTRVAGLLYPGDTRYYL